MTHTMPRRIRSAAAPAACLLAAVGAFAMLAMAARGAQPTTREEPAPPWQAVAGATTLPAREPSWRDDRPGPFDWLATQPASQPATKPARTTTTAPDRPGPFDWLAVLRPPKKAPSFADLPPPSYWPPNLLRMEGPTAAGFAGEVRARAADGQIDEALRPIQEVLDQPSDAYCPPARVGDWPAFWCYRSAHAQAADLLAGLGAKALARYAELYDPPARKLLDSARAAGDLDALARLAERYPGTPSAQAALERLDQAERKLHPPGSPVRAAKTWPGLGALGDGIAVMDECDTLLAPRWLQPTRGDGPGGLSDGPLTQLPAGALLRLLPGYDAAGHVLGTPALRLRGGQVIAATVESRFFPPTRESGLPERHPVVLPGVIHPIVMDGLVIVRLDEKVAAYDLLTGTTKWESLPFPIVRRIAPSPNARGYYFGPSPLIVDTGAYAMTSDGERVYFVYDIPPQDPRFALFAAANPVDANKSADLDNNSRLAAMSIAQEGRMVWRIGRGIGTDHVVREGRFLAAPACRDGRLYAMNLCAGRYYLLCLKAADGSLVWQSPVAQAPQTFPRDPGPDLRLGGGGPPAVVGQRVYVTTNAGVVAAFSARTGRALWATQYDPRSDWEAAGLTGYSRKTSRPYPPANPILVAGGRVICLPADAREVFALDANTGQVAWHVPRRDQDDLSAIDAARVLLSGPGMVVLAAKDGHELAAETANLGISGRPAVTPSAALACAAGKILRLDLKTYKVLTVGPASGNGLLGNLVSVDGRLLAANVAGVAAYFSFERGFAELTARLADTPAGMQAGVLMERAQFAYDAGRFDAALANLLAYRKLAPEQKDDAPPERSPETELERQQEAIREREREAIRERQTKSRQQEHDLLFHIYLALGNHAGDPAKMQAMYDQADALADTPRRKLEMLLRRAKCRQLAGDFAAAAAIAQDIMDKHGLEQIADVDVGPDAIDVDRLGARTTVLPAARVAADFLAAMIEIHGRDCYAPFDAQAAEALAQAQKAKDPAAMLAVGQRWPNSRSAAPASLAAAEALYLRARVDKPHAESLLAEARVHLGRLKDLPPAELRASAGVGLAAMYAEGGWLTSARVQCEALRRLPPQTQVSFGDFHGTLGEAIRQIESRLPAAPGTAPATTRAATEPPGTPTVP